MIKIFFAKNKTKIIIAALILLLCGLSIFFYSNWRYTVAESKAKDTILFAKTTQHTNDSIHYYTEATEQQMTIEQYKKLHETDSLTTLMAINLRNTEHIINMQLIASGQFTPHETVYDSLIVFSPKEIPDTIQVTKDTYDNGYLKYKCIQLAQGPKLVNYTYTPGLSININLYHLVKKWTKFLPKLRAKLGAKNDRKVDVISNDPNLKISKLDFITIHK